MKRFPAAGGDLRREDGIEPLARRFSAGTVAGAAVGATTPPGRRAPARRDARTIRTTTVTWNAQLARLERRGTRCWQHQAPAGELISEPQTPQRNSPAGQPPSRSSPFGLRGGLSAGDRERPLGLSRKSQPSHPHLRARL